MFMAIGPLNPRETFVVARLSDPTGRTTTEDLRKAAGLKTTNAVRMRWMRGIRKLIAAGLPAPQRNIGRAPKHVAQLSACDV